MPAPPQESDPAIVAALGVKDFPFLLNQQKRQSLTLPSRIHHTIQTTSSSIRFDALNRTYFNACAAIGAFYGVDHVNGIAFADGLHWTFRNTGTTSDAFFSNFMSHLDLLIGGSNIKNS